VRRLVLSRLPYLLSAAALGDLQRIGGIVLVVAGVLLFQRAA
jgi:hypothetical protein